MNSIRKVMLIDDDEDDHLIFGEAIRAVAPGVELVYVYGHKDLPASGPCNTPDILFLDINMPS